MTTRVAVASSSAVASASRARDDARRRSSRVSLSLSRANDDGDDDVLARRACLARVVAAATVVARVSTSSASARADPRTEVRREIKPSDFESLDACGARGRGRARTRGTILEGFRCR